MISERHPLLAAGAGQNTRMLPDEAVVPYCDTLGDGISIQWSKTTADRM
jgi:hypothetical protein